MLNADEVYELIGLNELERKIYETIVGLGAKTIEELVLYTGDSLPGIQSNLITLEQKGLIRRISGKVDILVAMEPRIVLSEKVEEDLTQKLSNVRDEITTKWNDVRNALSSQLQEFQGSTSGVINDHLEQFRKNVDLTKEQIDTISKDFGERVKSDSEKNREIITTTLKDHYSSYEETLTELQETLFGALDKNATDFEADMKSLNEQLTQAIREQISDWRVSVTSYQEKSGKLLESTEETGAEDIEKFKKDASESLTNLANIYTSGFMDAKAKTESTTISSMDAFKETLNGLLSNVSDTLNEQIRNIDAHISKTREGISSAVDGAGTIAASLDQEKTQLEEFNKTQREMFNNQLETFVGTEKEDITERMNQLKKEVSENLTKTFTAIRSLKTDFDGLLKSHASNMGKMQEELLNAISQTISENITKTKEIIQQTMKGVIEQVFEGSTRLQEKFGTLAYELSDFVNNSTISINAIIENSINEAKRLTEENQEKINEEIQANMRLIDETLSEVINKAKMSIDTTKEQIQEQFNTEHRKLKESNEKTSTDLLEMFSVSNKNIQKQLTESVQKITEHIEKASHDVCKQLDDSKTQNTGLMETFIDNLLTESMQIRDEVPSVIEKELEEHKDRINQLDIRFADTSGRLLSIVEDLRNKTEEKARSLFGLRKEGLKEFMDELTAMEGELQSLRAQIRDVINTNTEAYEVGVSSLLDNISRNMTYRIETIEKDAESNFGKMNTTYEAFVSNLTTILQGALKTETENALEGFTKGLEDQNSEAKNKIVLRLEENKEAINEMIYAAGQALTEKLNDAKTNFDEIQKTTIDTEGLGRAGKQINAQLDSLLEQFTESFSQYEKKITSDLMNHKMKITTRILEEITEQDSLLNTIKANTETLTNSLEETNESNLNSLQETIETILNEKGAEIESKNAALQKTAGEKFNAIKTETEQSVETLIEKITEEKIEESNSHLMELKQSISDVVVSVLEEIMQKASDFDTKLNTKLSETEDVFNKLSRTLEDSAELKDVTTELDNLSSSITEKVKEANDEISGIKRTIFDILEEKEEQGLQDLTGLQNKFDNILDQANTSVMQKIEELKETLITSSKEYLTKFDTRVDQITTRLDQLLSRPLTIVHEGSVDFKGNFSNLLSVQTTKYRDQIYTSIDKINEFLEKLGVEVETAAKQLNEKLSETTSSQIQNYEDTVVTHKDELLQIVTNRVEGIEKELTDVVNVIPAELEAAVTASNKAAHVLSTIQKLSRKAEPLPIEQTYRVIGDANITFNIKAIIERTKANLILVTPKFEDVPVDSLSTIKKTIRVTCVTELAEANMKDAGTLQERGNVRVRNYPDPKVYVISRDSEEVLIAPAVKGQKDLVGILSTNDHLIELINSELLSGYTAKSKAI